MYRYFVGTLKKIKMFKENNKVLDNEIGLHLEALEIIHR